MNRLVAGAALLLGLTACGGPSKQERAVQAEAAAHFVPPATISRLEFGGVAERRFRKLDRNDDQYITPDEYPRPDSAIAGFDTDGDGKVSGDEFGHGMIARFDAIDRNHDGTVTARERDEARAQRRGT